MADSSSHHKPPTKESGSPKSTTGANKSNPISGILSKSFLFLLFIVAIPLIPSQASNFIIQSLVSKPWELLPLLIIGLAVSYALFCSRYVEPSPNFDDSQASLVSRIFQVCPSFEDGYKNCDVGSEQIVHQSRDSPDNCYKGDDFENGTSGSFDGSLESGVGVEISVGNGQSSKIDAGNYDYLQGVVVSKESNELDGDGESEPVLDYKSLGLRPKSLNLETVCSVSPWFSDGSRFDSSSKRGVIEKEFGDMEPKNLEGEFSEVEVSSSSEILGHLRIGSMELREKVGSGGTNSSHLRPLSMDETQLESFKSRSLLSQASSMPHSPTRLSQSSSVSSETNSEMEELGKSKTFGASQSPLKTINGEAPLNAFRLRRYSNGPLFSKNVQVSSRDKLKASGGSRRDDSLRGNRETQQESEKPDTKPEVKASSKGKSVRALKYSQYPIDALVTGGLVKSQTDLGFGTSTEVKAAKSMRDETKSERVGLLSTETPKRNADPKPVHEGYQKKEQNATADTQEGLQMGAESFRVTSVGDDVIETMRVDLGCDSSEVDRRAGEFIAKFREQIMLQKVASMERSRQRRMVANHLR